jgi:hypothetical protein
MKIDIWDIILGVLTFLSVIWAIISEPYRILAIIISFVLLTIIIISKQNMEISIISSELKRIEEKLKIHESIRNIEARLISLEKGCK